MSPLGARPLHGVCYRPSHAGLGGTAGVWSQDPASRHLDWQSRACLLLCRISPLVHHLGRRAEPGRKASWASGAASSRVGRRSQGVSCGGGGPVSQKAIRRAAEAASDDGYLVWWVVSSSGLVGSGHEGVDGGHRQRDLGCAESHQEISIVRRRDSSAGAGRLDHVPAGKGGALLCCGVCAVWGSARPRSRVISTALPRRHRSWYIRCIVLGLRVAACEAGGGGGPLVDMRAARGTDVADTVAT